MSASTSAGSSAAAAAGSSTSSTSSAQSRSSVLLDRIRAKSAHFRPLSDLSKATRTVLLDRRFSIDIEEKAILQKCLDLLQEKIPVSTAAGMAERLETIGRKIGLKFMAAPVHGCYYLSTEMFYVEINIDANSGAVNEAKVHHIDATQANAQPSAENCPEIMDCLSKGDFAKFIEHLEGLSSIYDLGTAETKEKSRAWNALNSVEKDLEQIFNGYFPWNGDPLALLHTTHLGMVLPRQGGLPMKIKYFLPPYELIDEKTNSLLKLSQDLLREKDLGHYATVILEKSETPVSMPIRTLMTVPKTGPFTGEDFNPSNSVTLPARFALELKHPMPILLEQCREIEGLTGFEFANDNEAIPMMQLITRNKTDNHLDTANNRGLFVTLPDQQHCYFLSDPPEFAGVMVTRIPFAHPTNVVDIVRILRQQSLFNALIESCARVNSIQDLEKSIMFEVSCTDLQHLSVTFEHPGAEVECMATVEVDLTDHSNVRCKMFTAANTAVCPEELVNKIITQCMSIPVTMRAVIRHNAAKMKANNPNAMETDGLKSSNDNSASNLNIKPEESDNNNMDFTVSSKSDMDNGFHTNRDRGGGGGGSEEPMDFDLMGLPPISTAAPVVATHPVREDAANKANNSPFKSGPTSSLNEYGPQDATSNPEASQKSSLVSSSSNASHVKKEPTSSSSSSSKDCRTTSTSSSSSSVKKVKNEVSIKPGSEQTNTSPSYGIKPEFMLTKSSQPPSSSTSSSSAGSKDSATHKDTIKKEPTSLVPDIKPSVSITPISSANSNATGRKSQTAIGIEIIPLGGAEKSESSSAGSSTSSKNRDIRRSLSEDDKRRLDKKSSSGSGSSSKKRKHESSRTDSGSSSAKKKILTSSPDSRSKHPASGSSSRTDMGLEIVPTGSSSSSASSKPKSSSSKSSSSSSSSSLKMTIKNPSKYPKEGSSSSSSSYSKPKSSSSSSPSSKDKYSSSSSSSKHSSSSSNSKSSSSSSSSSSHRHSSSGTGGGSSSSSSKDRSSSSGNSSSKSSSSSSSKDRDKDRNRGSSSSNSDRPRSDHHSSSSTSSSSSSSHRSSGSDRDRHQKEKDEVKKLLDGGKLNKTFQIPKLAKGSSPSTTPGSTPSQGKMTPTTSPKYSVSPKQSSLQQQLASSSSSPKYIGGGSVTPPNVSPKHPYSAPSSVPGLTRSSPLHSSPNTTPKAYSRTPSASPTHGAAGLARGFQAPHGGMGASAFITPEKGAGDPMGDGAAAAALGKGSSSAKDGGADAAGILDF